MFGTGRQVEGNETLASTSSVSPDFWKQYHNAAVGKGLFTPIRLRDTLQGTTLQKLQGAISEKALNSPVHVTDWMPDRSFAAPVPDASSPSGYRILINSRYLAHPEYLEHVLAEEGMHVERYLKGRPMDMSLPYEQRLHELTAKAGADYAVGHTLPDLPVYQMRPHPADVSGLSQQSNLHPIGGGNNQVAHMLFQTGDWVSSANGNRYKVLDASDPRSVWVRDLSADRTLKLPANSLAPARFKPAHYFMDSGNPTRVQVLRDNGKIARIVRKDGKLSIVPHAWLKPIFPDR